MATTYNNIYLSVRRRLRAAGIPAAREAIRAATGVPRARAIRAAATETVRADSRTVTAVQADFRAATGAVQADSRAVTGTVLRAREAVFREEGRDRRTFPSPSTRLSLRSLRATEATRMPTRTINTTRRI